MTAPVVTRFAPAQPDTFTKATPTPHCRPGILRKSTAVDSSFGSRTSTTPAAVQRTPSKSSKTSPGSGSNWEEPVRIQSQHLDEYRDAAEQNSKQQGLSLSLLLHEKRHPTRNRVAPGRPLTAAKDRSTPAPAAKLSTRRANEARIADGEAHALRIDLELQKALDDLNRESNLTWH